MPTNVVAAVPSSRQRMAAVSTRRTAQTENAGIPPEQDDTGVDEAMLVNWQYPSGTMKSVLVRTCPNAGAPESQRTAASK
jgi:hypothetical protein